MNLRKPMHLRVIPSARFYVSAEVAAGLMAVIIIAWLSCRWAPAARMDALEERVDRLERRVR